MGKKETIMQYTFETEGVCSTRIEIELDGNIVKSVQFVDGCDGNLSAIARLVVGMTVEQVQEKLSGVTCDDRPTSCPDQLARALTEALAKESSR